MRQNLTNKLNIEEKENVVKCLLSLLRLSEMVEFEQPETAF
jgi:hypothetical protein